MSGAPSCEKTGLKKGPWTPEEDRILINYIQKNGHGSWRALPKLAGLLRCGKSCRLRWTNYLRPDIKRGSFTDEEERTIIQLHAILGNRWSAIASQLPGRTDNEIKNFWCTHMKKRLLKMGLDPTTHAPKEEADTSADPQRYEALALTRHKAQWENARLEAEARLSRASLFMSSDSTAGYHTNNSALETIRTPNDNPPVDYFLKIWNSEAGKAFRKKTHHPSGGGEDPVSSSEIPPTSVSFLYYASTQNSCDQSLNPDDKDKGNASQQCNSASFEWNGDCNVLPCIADMSMCQTEDKAAEELGPEHAVDYTGFGSEVLLDFHGNDDNNNNTYSIHSESSTGFQHQFSSPWPQLHDEDYWRNVPFSAEALHRK